MRTSGALKIACLLSTLLAINTCLQIEHWNQLAGGYLPRTDFGSGTASGDQRQARWSGRIS